jgi:protein phosphatase 2C family protein 2/3
VRSFAANTHVGLVRKANEDRIAIILNVIQPVPKEPKMSEAEWPKIQIFAVYDGHGGNQCAEYLKEHFHNEIILQPDFPHNVNAAIIKGSHKTDEKYISSVYHEY